MLSIYHKTAREKEIRILENFKEGTWVHAEKPDAQELNYLTTTLGLDPDLLEDALDAYEVPRLEEYEGITYIYVRVPSRKGEKVSTIPFLVAVGKNFVITVSQDTMPFLEKFMKKNFHFSTNQKVPLLLAILTEIDVAYNYFLTRISREIRSNIVDLENIDTKDIIQFVLFESILNDLLAALVPMSTIIQKLLFRKSLPLNEETKNMIEDLALSNGEHRELCQTNLKAIVNIREGYSTIMSNNLNRFIRLLTVLTIMLTIPTIISSLLGMNVPLPFFSHNPHALWYVLLITFGIWGIFLYIVFKKRWF
jgi:magnesium transporter